MIAAGLPLRCVALEATGEYDTHAGQAAALTPALTTTAASLYAFQRDLEARGVADRVLTLVWSEFGRRAKENGSGGTDHGAAGTGVPDRDARCRARRSASSRASRRGLDARRQPQGDVATSAASTRRCSSSGSRFDAARVIPERDEVQAAAARQVKLAARRRRCSARSLFSRGAGSRSRVQVVAREYSFSLSRLQRASRARR